MANFPNAMHDDDVDSTTRALNYLIGRGPGANLLEYYRAEANKLGQARDQAAVENAAVRLRVPQGHGGVSTERGMIRPDADGCITVPPILAGSLIAAGYTRVEAQVA